MGPIQRETDRQGDEEMRYQVFIDCEGDGDIVDEWSDYDSLSEEARQRQHESSSQCIGYFYAGDWEADSPEDALEMARQWIIDEHVFVFPGA
jgi:hypothetical protein